MYQRLLAQRMTRYNVQWYCYLCKCAQSDFAQAKNHLQEVHFEEISTTNEILKFLSESNISNAQCNKLIRGGIVLKNLPQQYFCIVCQCLIPTLIHVDEHLKGKQHQTYIKGQQNSLANVQQTHTKESNLNKSAVSLSINCDLPMHNDIKLRKNESHPYFCEICECKLNSLNNIYMHLNGIRHKQCKKDREKNSRGNQKVSNSNTNDNASTSKEDSTSKTQTLNCVKDTLIDTSINVSSSTTPGLFMSPNISKEMNELLMIKPLETIVKQNKNSDYYNKKYRAEYLIFEEIMFSCQQMMLKKIKEYLKFYIPSANGCVTCLACNVAHSSLDVQVWYEHVSCRDHEHIINRSLSAESKLLLKHLMSKQLEHVKCYPCKENISVKQISQDATINAHVRQASHQKNRNKLLTEIVESHFNSLSKKTIDSLCYDIQYFACTLCKSRFKIKIEFMDHLSKYHQSVMCNKINRGFGFCVICAIMWYEGDDRFYSKHCKTQIHRYLEKSNDFMIKPLPTKVTNLLKHIDKNVATLWKISTNKLTEFNTHRIIQDLKHTLKSHHLSTVEVYMFGSRYTGLALSYSDIDIYVDFGEECNDANLNQSRSKQIEKCLRADCEVWKVEEILKNARTPIIRLKHILTGIDCDISYMNGISVENSKFIRCLNEAYSPCQKLILFLKKWMQLWQSIESKKISNYALTWLVIFYLQVKHGIPSIASLIKREKSKIISGWQVIVGDSIAINTPELPIHELLLGFFEYYGEFDYMHSVICPLLGDKCDKQLFTASYEKQTFPESMKPYVTHLQSLNPEFFRVDSPMCVQDPFVLSFNITRAVPVLTLKSFKLYCKESASKLREMALC